MFGHDEAGEVDLRAFGVDGFYLCDGLFGDGGQRWVFEFIQAEESAVTGFRIFRGLGEGLIDHHEEIDGSPVLFYFCLGVTDHEPEARALFFRQLDGFGGGVCLDDFGPLASLVVVLDQAIAGDGAPRNDFFATQSEDAYVTGSGLGGLAFLFEQAG